MVSTDDDDDCEVIFMKEQHHGHSQCTNDTSSRVEDTQEEVIFRL